MRAIVLMFDSLNRRMLPPYGDRATIAPNFARLAERTVTFDTCYAGSMPCMPARREMHSARHNFLHRSWSPLEPFDDSVPEMLKKAGVYTHMITDHQHYWEDGGATYHNRFCSYEFFRGQEGDLWKADVANTDHSRLGEIGYRMFQQDGINRKMLRQEKDHPQTGVFNAGLEFLETNAEADNWMVQIETFDPHEPFFSYEKYQALYPEEKQGVDPDFDWPPYSKVTEDEASVEHARNRYLALLSMCDQNLGRVLDMMDAKDMWKDTMLIVCTDHGYMLGERGWWAKSVMPWYDETIHTPLFVWDPRQDVAGERRASLVQTIDFGPTLLDLFGVEPTPDMLGKSIAPVIASDTPIHEGGLFGSHGGHVSVTDGRFVYMRAPANPQNAPLFDYTLMPMNMRSLISPALLADAELHAPFSFTKGAPVLKLRATTAGNPYQFGTLLFDMQTDPAQENPLDDPALELRMTKLLVKLMRENDAPLEQYERLGLPASGDVGEQYLLVAAQKEQAAMANIPAVRRDAFPANAIVATKPVQALMQKESINTLLLEILPILQNRDFRQFFGDKTVIEIAAITPGFDKEKLDGVEEALQKLLL